MSRKRGCGDEGRIWIDPGAGTMNEPGRLFGMGGFAVRTSFIQHSFVDGEGDHPALISINLVAQLGPVVLAELWTAREGHGVTHPLSFADEGRGELWL